MKEECVILIAEEDSEDFELIRRGLLRAGVRNQLIRFVDDQAALDFLFETDDSLKRQPQTEYILLLDISSPKINGIEILEKIKHNNQLRKMPVIILSSKDDPAAIEHYHNLGCSTYIVKPVENKGFMNTVEKIGRFLSVVEIPRISKTE